MANSAPTSSFRRRNAKRRDSRPSIVDDPEGTRRLCRHLPRRDTDDRPYRTLRLHVRRLGPSALSLSVSRWFDDNPQRPLLVSYPPDPDAMTQRARAIAWTAGRYVLFVPLATGVSLDPASTVCLSPMAAAGPLVWDPTWLHLAARAPSDPRVLENSTLKSPSSGGLCRLRPLCAVDRSPDLQSLVTFRLEFRWSPFRFSKLGMRCS
jgi:hypothetical protein